MHNKKYGLVGIGLVEGYVKNGQKLKEQEKIEQLLIDSDFLLNAPFKCIVMIYRYGTKNMLIPEYQRINKKRGELPIAIEIKMEILEWADQNNLKLLYDIFMIGILDALLHVGKKYNLPTELIEKERVKYGQIPGSTEECRLYRAATMEDYKFLKDRRNVEINLCANCGNVKATAQARYCLKCREFHEPQLV